MPFGSFADLAKWAYVDVAVRDFGAKGGKQSTSRIFILNSLSRREVSQLRITEALCDSVEVDRYNRAVCVIGGKITDERFSDKEGHPLALPFEKGEASFRDLVRNCSGDFPARAILDEFVRVGLVKAEKNDIIHLLSRAYIPWRD